MNSRGECSFNIFFWGQSSVYFGKTNHPNLNALQQTTTIPLCTPKNIMSSWMGYLQLLPHLVFANHFCCIVDKVLARFLLFCLLWKDITVTNWVSSMIVLVATIQYRSINEVIVSPNQLAICKIMWALSMWSFINWLFYSSLVILQNDQKKDHKITVLQVKLIYLAS